MHSIAALSGFWNMWKALIDGHASLLEIGCGTGKTAVLFDCPIRVGVDIHRPYLENRVATAHFIPLCLDARRLSEVFLPRTFAVTALFDVIEHFTPAEAEEVLAAAERIATHRVVVFTPRGFFPQQEFDLTGLGGGQYQVHRSGWTDQDFQSRGYNVVILHGLHGPENPAFIAACGLNAPRVDALLAWKDVSETWIGELAVATQSQ